MADLLRDGNHLFLILCLLLLLHLSAITFDYSDLFCCADLIILHKPRFLAFQVDNNDKEGLIKAVGMVCA